MPKKIILIFGFSLVLLTLLFLYLIQDDTTTDKGSFQSSNWEESYLVADSNPRGISIFNELLEFRTKKTSVVLHDELQKKDLKDVNTTYIFVGSSFQLKTEEFKSVLNLVEDGANLFIAFDAVSENIYEHFFHPSEFVWDYSDRQYISFGKIKKPLKLCPVNQLDTVAMNWNFFFFDSLRLDDENRVELVTSLSSIKGYCNLLDAKIGKGHVYLHSNPELFQNYQLLSPNGYAYGQFMVDLIPENHQIKWLELGRIDEESMSNQQNSSGGKRDTSYLQFIFNNVALTIALLLAILGVILYLIFRTKRSKPLIPYLPKTANHSLSFAETIKEIYYKQQTPYSILQVMHKNFVVAVNKQFFIDLSKTDRENEMKVLAEKSGIELKRIEELLKNFETKLTLSVDYAYLQKVSAEQQQFYRDTGIIKQKMYDRIMAKTQRINRPMWMPLLLIFAGIFSILYGFYLLFLAEGIGILLWPSGIIMLSVGIRMLALPVLKIQEESVTFYNVFGRKQKYKKDEISKVEVGGGTTRFTCHDDRTYQINHSNISQYDRNAYEQFISPFLKDQL